MAKYRVKPGFTHGLGNVYQAGDIVEMTEAEAAGFLDKLELVIDEPKPAAKKPAKKSAAKKEASK